METCFLPEVGEMVCPVLVKLCQTRVPNPSRSPCKRDASPGLSLKVLRSFTPSLGKRKAPLCGGGLVLVSGRGAAGFTAGHRSSVTDTDLLSAAAAALPSS